jgi:hypothetical protein
MAVLFLVYPIARTAEFDAAAKQGKLGNLTFSKIDPTFGESME